MLLLRKIRKRMIPEKKTKSWKYRDPIEFFSIKFQFFSGFHIKKYGCLRVWMLQRHAYSIYILCCGSALHIVIDDHMISHVMHDSFYCWKNIVVVFTDIQYHFNADFISVFFASSLDMFTGFMFIFFPPLIT